MKWKLLCRCVGTYPKATSALAARGTSVQGVEVALRYARRAACAALACSRTCVAATSATWAPTAPSNANVTDTHTAKDPTNSTNVLNATTTPWSVHFLRTLSYLSVHITLVYFHDIISFLGQSMREMQTELCWRPY